MDTEKPARRADAARPHTLYLDKRRQAALTGVKEVLAFDDHQVILGTDLGEIALTGSHLHVTKLMLEDGQLTVEGQVDSVFYAQKKKRRGLRGRGA